MYHYLLELNDTMTFKYDATTLDDNINITISYDALNGTVSPIVFYKICTTDLND
jgi:hypothetical protein